MDADASSNPTPGREASSSKEGAPKSSSDRRIIRGTKAPDIPIYERKNWLIHLHYIRKDFETCKVLIRELLDETDDMCEYGLYILGLIYRQEGDVQMSLEQFRKAVHLNPNNASSMKQAARSLFLLGKHKSAMEGYAEASKMNPRDWELLHNQGVCCVCLEDLDQAIELFQAAISLSPQTVSFKQLGRVYLKRGAVEDAIEIYTRAIKYTPEDPDLLTTLGLLYLHVESNQKAFNSFGRALTFDPVNPKAILAAGSLMQNQKEYDVSLSKYRAAAASTPESPQLWNNIGMCFFGKEKYVAAISCLKRATYLAPLEWKILYNLGLVHLSMEQYASAFHFLRAAVGCKPPRVGKIEHLLAITLSRLDDLSTAKEMYENAIKHERDDPLIHLNYAMFCHNTQEYEEGRRQFRLFERKRRHDNLDPEMLEISKKLSPVFIVGESPLAVSAKSKAPPTKDHAPSTDDDDKSQRPVQRQRQGSVFQKVHDL